jgi:hypothetical protein
MSPSHPTSVLLGLFMAGLRATFGRRLQITVQISTRSRLFLNKWLILRRSLRRASDRDDMNAIVKFQSEM